MHRFDLAETKVATLVLGQDHPLGMVIVAKHAYWAVGVSTYEISDYSAADGRILSVNRHDGFNMKTRVENPACPMNLSIQGGKLF